MRKVVESRLKGDFEGWDSKLVYTLEDGSSWQLIFQSYRFGYTCRWRPKACVYVVKGCHFLLFEGEDSAQPVRRIAPFKTGKSKKPRKPDIVNLMKVLTCQLELAHKAEVEYERSRHRGKGPGDFAGRA